MPKKEKKAPSAKKTSGAHALAKAAAAKAKKKAKHENKPAFGTKANAPLRQATKTLTKADALPTEAPETIAPAAKVPAAKTPVPKTPVAKPPVAKPPVAKAPRAKAPADKAPVEAPLKETPQLEVSPATPQPAAAPAVEAVEPEVEATPDLPLFSELGLSEPIAKAIADMGFETPTPIQARAVPILLKGHDLIGQAQTGTGKTAAFALPLIQHIDPAKNVTQALVLAPTRELAVQVAGGIHDLAKHTGLRVVPIYGGQPIDRQFRALRAGAHIVVGTPGRVQDHMRRNSLSLQDVTFCVLDEADEMLALGFLEEIETILSELPEERQLAFFSATVPPKIAGLMKKFLRNPERISIEAKQRTLTTIKQTYYEVTPGKKLEALARVLDMETPGPTIIFCRTRQETNDLAEALRLRGYTADALHGDMGQPERERVLKRFRDELSDVLVATDVAARGLDIDHVTHVINYDIPWDVEQYIHRIGRTGRAGRTGDAITFVEGRERRQLKLIEKLTGATIKPTRLPTAADIAARRRELFKEALREALEADGFDGHLATVEELSADHDPTAIAAAALQLLWQSQHEAATEAAQEIAADGAQPEQGMTRLFLGIGRQDHVRPGDLVGAIANEAGLSGQAIGTIDIFDRSTFVEVPADSTDRVIAALRNTKIRGRKVNVQIARPVDERR